MANRRGRVLIEDAFAIAKKLRANPGTPDDEVGWHLSGIGQLDEARVLAQTAYRIRLNYRPDERGRRRGLRAFAADETGYFEAISTANQSRPDPVAPVELFVRFVLDPSYDEGSARQA